MPTSLDPKRTRAKGPLGFARVFGSFEVNARVRTVRFHRERVFHAFPTHPAHVQHARHMFFPHLDKVRMIGIRPSQFSNHPVPDVGVKGCELVSGLIEQCEAGHPTSQMRLEVAVGEDRVLDPRGIDPTFDITHQPPWVVVFELGQVLDGT